MKLYEINLAIEELTDQIEVDPETGELLGDFVSLYQQIEACRWRNPPFWSTWRKSS